MGHEGSQSKIGAKRWALVCLSVIALFLIYVFQRINIAGFLLAGFSPHPNVIFIINKTIRLVLNDLCCLAIIWAIFQEKKYLQIAFYVLLLELLVILPVYFGIKLSLEGDSEISSPLLSQIHRLIVNPTLMLLLMVGFFYQRYTGKTA